MNDVRVIEVKQSVFANNEKRASLLRDELKRKKTYLLNVMSSPGSGKTTTLVKTINLLKNDLKIAVMEADIDSDKDGFVKMISTYNGLPFKFQPSSNDAATAF